MIWPVTEQQQREEIKKTWSIFPTGINDPIHLRALWPKRLPGKKAARNITFTAKDYPEVSDRQRAFEAKALELNAQGFNSYIALNPIAPSFPGNQHNGLAVKDEHISCRGAVSRMRTRLRWAQLSQNGLTSGGEILPFGQRGRAEGLVGLAVDEVALGLKVVGDRGVDRGEFL